jgi:hypothetical protein
MRCSVCFLVAEDLVRLTRLRNTLL